MDAFLRTLAIIIEVLLLAVIAYAVLAGVRLTAIDLGLKARYGRAISMALILVGAIILVFYIAHLITFYPSV